MLRTSSSIPIRWGRSESRTTPRPSLRRASAAPSYTDMHTSPKHQPKQSEDITQTIRSASSSSVCLSVSSLWHTDSSAALTSISGQHLWYDTAFVNKLVSDLRQAFEIYNYKMKTCTSLLISEHALSNNACYKNNILLKSTGQHPPSIKTNIISHELTLIILLNRIISCRRIPSVWPQFPSIAQSMPLSKPSPVHKPTESFNTMSKISHHNDRSLNRKWWPH